MKNVPDVLCEIIFKDPKLGILTSRIGMIDKSILKLYSTNSNDFIIFKERYNSPILKSDIIDIIIHYEGKISINNINSRIKSQNKGKIS